MDPVEEINQINSTVTTIEREINELSHKRANLLRRLNFLQSLVISKLPSEILARIFRHAHEPLKPNGYLFSPAFPRFPKYVCTLFRIGAVCSQWRETAWSSPQLWTFIPLWGRFSGKSMDYAALTRTFCTNSGSLPISLYIRLWEPEPENQVDESMNLIFAENSGRLKSLHLLNPSERSNIVWPIICKYAQQDIEFSQLADVAIDWDDWRIPEKGAIFCNSPLLRSLSLRASPRRCIMLDFPWSQLTKVNLTGISPQLLHQDFISLLQSNRIPQCDT